MINKLPKGPVGLTGDMPADYRQRILHRIEALERRVRWMMWAGAVVTIALAVTNAGILYRNYKAQPERVSCRQLDPWEYRTEYIEADFKVLRECAK